MGFTLPSAGVTPAPSDQEIAKCRRRRVTIAKCRGRPFAPRFCPCVIQSAAKNPGSGSPSHHGKGLGSSASPAMLAESLLPLQPRIIILHTNRIRIPLNINVLGIILLSIDHSRAKILTTLPRRKTIDMLPLRQRRLPLQPPPRTINRRRDEDPSSQHHGREMRKSQIGSLALIRHSTGILRFALE